ncbi:hypothetical protein [Fictibacillus sp. UD]|uniref:hypothetical protein n=1 Tax=Fictibacillus sp. UD TaxID=3038777 RepID=UPI00374845D0
MEGALCLLSHLAFDLEGLATATGQVRHLRVKRTKVAHRLPRGKRSTWSENQLTFKIIIVCKQFKLIKN